MSPDGSSHPYVLLLTDGTGRIFGSVEIERSEADLRLGKFTPNDWPADLADLFGRYDELVNGNMLSLLDEIAGEIDARGFRVLYPGSSELYAIKDLQIYRDHRISFRMR